MCRTSNKKNKTTTVEECVTSGKLVEQTRTFSVQFRWSDHLLGTAPPPVQNEVAFPSLHWLGTKGEERSLWPKLLSPLSLHLSVSVPCFLSCSLMDSNVLPCRRDQCEVVVLFNSHSPAHMHVRFAKVLSQLHHSMTTCRNTCTSVQQWSINDNSNK